MKDREESLLDRIRSEAKAIFLASLKPVNPEEAVKRFIRIEGSRLIAGPADSPAAELDLNNYKRIFLVGGGKATAPMALAMEKLFAGRITRGIINVKYGFTEKLSFTEIVEADHPVPDLNGVEGAGRIIELLNSAGEKDLIFSLISGGGSALLPKPAGEITLEEKQAMTKKLLECGASIDEINSIRKHISSSKGGQMARAAFPATVINLMLSDVVGDRMDVIASGPFVPDSSTFDDTLRIIKKYSLKDIPSSIEKHLRSGMEGGIPETPKEGDAIFERVHNIIVGSNILAVEAAAAEAVKRGYHTIILSSMIEGETRDVARVHTAIAKEIIKTGRPAPAPCCVITGGETTVTIRGNGKGGRNQEFCLAAAVDIKDLPERVVVLSGGTDGNDGPTDAAGGIVDPLTISRGREAGVDALKFLSNNDSYSYLNKTGDLLMTGPTNTNVMDVRVVLVK